MQGIDERSREKELVSFMITLYCRKKHGGKPLCLDCTRLKEYAEQRLERCPFMKEKTFCSNCKVHCYQPQMREKIREVMRFSGPRMILYHPTVAVRHIIESAKERKRKEMEKTE